MSAGPKTRAARPPQRSLGRPRLSAPPALDAVRARAASCAWLKGHWVTSQLPLASGAHVHTLRTPPALYRGAQVVRCCSAPPVGTPALCTRLTARGGVPLGPCCAAPSRRERARARCGLLLPGTTARRSSGAAVHPLLQASTSRRWPLMPVRRAKGSGQRRLLTALVQPDVRHTPTHPPGPLGPH